MNFRLLLLTVSIVSLALLSCEEAEDNLSKNEDSTTQESKEVFTEIITRTYSVKLGGEEAKVDTLQQINSVTIDSEGRETEITFYNLDFTPKWTDKFEHDEKGFQVSSNHFVAGEEQTVYYKYKNDSQGRRISYEAFDLETDKSIHRGELRYENDGKLKRDGYINSEGEFISNFEYEYSAEGEELGYTYIDLLSGKRFTSNYEYVDFNEENQWIKRLIVQKDVVQLIETREFKRN